MCPSHSAVRGLYSEPPRISLWSLLQVPCGEGGDGRRRSKEDPCPRVAPSL